MEALTVGLPHEPQDPVARLWHQLEPWFREELDEEAIWKRDRLGIMPSHGVSFTGVQPADLDEAWQFIAGRVRPPFASMEWPDAETSQFIEVAREGSFAAANRRYMPLVFRVKGIEVADQRLPPLQVGVGFDRDLVGLFWAVGDDTGWEPEHVAALAVLIDDLRTLLPRNPMTFDRQPEIIKEAIDTYLEARSSEGEPPAP